MFSKKEFEKSFLSYNYYSKTREVLEIKFLRKRHDIYIVSDALYLAANNKWKGLVNLFLKGCVTFKGEDDIYTLPVRVFQKI